VSSVPVIIHLPSPGKHRAAKELDSRV
jgi:hypothetical protein